MPDIHAETLDLCAPAAGRPLRVVLLGFYNYESHALRIFHPLLKRRGHDVHSIFFKNYFTFEAPPAQEEDMVVDLIARIRPDVVAMSVWSTYYQLAARLSATHQGGRQPARHLGRYPSPDLARSNPWSTAMSWRAARGNTSWPS